MRVANNNNYFINIFVRCHCILLNRITKNSIYCIYTPTYRDLEWRLCHTSTCAGTLLFSLISMHRKSVRKVSNQRLEMCQTTASKWVFCYIFCHFSYKKKKKNTDCIFFSSIFQKNWIYKNKCGWCFRPLIVPYYSRGTVFILYLFWVPYTNQTLRCVSCNGWWKVLRTWTYNWSQRSPVSGGVELRVFRAPMSCILSSGSDRPLKQPFICHNDFRIAVNDHWNRVTATEMKIKQTNLLYLLFLSRLELNICIELRFWTKRFSILYYD